MNSKQKVPGVEQEVPRVEMVTIPLAYSLPGGGEATGYVTVTPEVTQKTLAALRCLMEAGAAAAMDREWRQAQAEAQWQQKQKR